jgi:hypothetical protein
MTEKTNITEKNIRFVKNGIAISLPEDFNPKECDLYIEFKYFKKQKR